MKTKSLIYSGMFMSLLCIAGCSDDDASDKSAIGIANITNSGCKNINPEINSSLRTAKLSQEYIEYVGTVDGGLRISHVNSMFSCEQDEIKISVSVSDNLIIVNEEEIGADANCICPFDLSYDVSSLETGKEYVLVIQKAGHEKTRVTFVYIQTISGKQLIEK